MKTIKKMSVLMFVGLSIVTANLAQTSKTRQPTQGNPPHPLVQQVGGHWSANKPAGTTEGYEIHTVKQGDTLWDISRQYLKDPFLWPQIWEANPSINNPHWIYPGDQILIKKVTVMTAAPPAPVQAEAPKSAEPPPTRRPPASEPVAAAAPPTSVAPRQPGPVATYTDLYCSGYFSVESVQAKAILVGGEESENKSIFSDRDVVYLNQGTASGLKPGEELQVVRTVTDFNKWGSEFARAKSKTRYGQYYQDLGRLRVLLAQENSAVAEVIFACEELVAGDLAIPGEQRVSPLQQPDLIFDKFAPPSKTAGKIFMTKEFRKLMGMGNIVYVDLGSKQNVQVGDHFRVVRPFHKDNIGLFNREDYKSHQSTFDSMRKVIGEMVVLRAEPNASTALITYSTQDIVLGDTVELK